MAKKFYIASQAPFVELEIVSEKDAEGISEKLLVGFKRYGLAEAQEKINSFKELSESEAQTLLQKEVLYIKNAQVKVYDDETLEVVDTIKVSDTRKAQPYEPFWGDKNEALAVLLEHYLDSTPWRGSFIQGYIKSLINLDYKDAEAKN